MIGIDVGGANLKIVDESGVHIHYCPLWKDAPLYDILKEYSGESAAVVMSGELADAFSSKFEGIAHIVREVKRAIPSARFYGTDGYFHDSPCPQLAAANWLASADHLRAEYPDALVVDMGSTTTDIIPLFYFEELLGMTDLARLQRKLLVYTGLLRTPLFAHLSSVPIGGIPTLVASELFAVSADAHLVLGHISEEEYSVPTPDNAPCTYSSSLRRLARIVCADLEEIGEDAAVGIAEAFWAAQGALVQDAAEHSASPKSRGRVLCAGVGSQVMQKVFGGIDLRRELGEAADALPAFAVREVAERGA